MMIGNLEPEEKVMESKPMNFTVYSKQGCPYCIKVVEVLQLAELRHVVYELNRDFDRESFYGQFGRGSTFPQVVLNGDNLGGCTETVKYLQEKKLV
tara:strand:+ start:141 stop:428 length:288 start_codon:yes stop_codon:yes gene_type:complete